MQRSESFRGFEQKLNMTEFKVKIGFNLFGSVILEKTGSDTLYLAAVKVKSKDF